jgi:hypothetical protein
MPLSMWIAAGLISLGIGIGIDGPKPCRLMYYLEEAGYLEPTTRKTFAWPKPVDTKS